jgi:tetratricopeptide (TPR) repeat protein
VEALQKAVELKPAYAAAHYNLALALRGTGRDREAAQAFEEAFRLDPTLRQNAAR